MFEYSSTRILQEEGQSSKPWGEVIAATFIVNLTTFTAVFVIGLTTVTRKVTGKGFSNGFLRTLQNIVLPSFACGALLATALLFVIPEALEQIAGGHEEEHSEEEHSDEGRRRLSEESETAWKFGTSVIAGFLFPILLSVFFVHDHNHHDHNHGCNNHYDEHEHSHSATKSLAIGQSDDQTQIDETKNNNDNQNKTDEVDINRNCDSEVTADAVSEDMKPKVVKINYALAASLLLGGFLHLFSDGIFIGVAFLVCGQAFAYTMVLSTVYHELCHQLSDFMLLINKCGLTFRQAMVFNFLSGTSVVIGGVMALAINFSSMSIGVILSMSAGLFIQIAACECIPMMQKNRETPKEMLIFFASFMCGAVPIGLVLLNHKHCEG